MSDEDPEHRILPLAKHRLNQLRDRAEGRKRPL